jgi:ribA/ribD-fused uncharacterized protein
MATLMPCSGAATITPKLTKRQKKLSKKKQKKKNLVVVVAADDDAKKTTTNTTPKTMMQLHACRTRAELIAALAQPFAQSIRKARLLFFWSHHERVGPAACLSQWFPSQFEEEAAAGAGAGTGQEEEKEEEEVKEEDEAEEEEEEKEEEAGAAVAAAAAAAAVKKDEKAVETKKHVITYGTAEQYMMAEKARLFNDVAVLNKILGTAHGEPKRCKGLGRKVQNFDEATWQRERFAICVRGNLLKFSQDATLRAYLLSTGTRVLVEAHFETRTGHSTLPLRHLPLAARDAQRNRSAERRRGLRPRCRGWG